VPAGFTLGISIDSTAHYRRLSSPGGNVAKVSVPGFVHARRVAGRHERQGLRRKAAVQSAIKSIGGKLESFYYAFGDDDVVLIADLPDNVSAAAITLTTGSTGLVNIRTTPLLTVDEVDKALEITAKYRPPGGK